jgi:hypothetical protein
MMTRPLLKLALVLTAWTGTACHHAPSPDAAAISETKGDQNGGSSISGRVFDATSQDPVQGAVASVAPVGRDSRTSGAASGATDQTGLFVLTNLLPGDYDLKVAKIGYTNWSARARVRLGSSGTFNVTLQRTVGQCPRVMPGVKPTDCR